MGIDDSRRHDDDLTGCGPVFLLAEDVYPGNHIYWY